MYRIVTSQSNLEEDFFVADLTLEWAKELTGSIAPGVHLYQHAMAVSGAMAAMARHFGEDPEYWEAVGFLHDYDYGAHPDEHLQHTEAPLRDAGVDEESIRAIMAHGYGVCTDVEPKTNLEKSLFTVDELTGLIAATARMRPTGISDLEPKSVKKKFKDKAFAAKIDRDVIQKGADMLGMDLDEIIAICIEGMKPFAADIGLPSALDKG